jgi:general stress protein CsbA
MRNGHYQFTMVPFVFSNATVVFMCLMNGILREYLDKFFIVFLDEILIYFKYIYEHEKNFKWFYRY